MYSSSSESSDEYDFDEPETTERQHYGMKNDDGGSVILDVTAHKKDDETDEEQSS